MFAFIALATLIQAPGASAPAGNPAINAFREACVEGSLKLSPARGRILEEREMTGAMEIFRDWGRPRNRTVVKLNESPSSYVVIAEYKVLQPRSFARSCGLVSSSISKREAMAAFLEGLPDKEIAPNWVPAMYQPIWTSDHPELGYRKQLRFRSDSIVLEVDLYPTAAAQMNSGATKQ